jgi:type II secretory pathway pseudopilin PulG
MPRPVRTGFTLFQLLLVLALLAILFALFLPAVLRVRAVAARTASANNLKQMGLAVHNYAAVYNDKLPPGCDENNFSASAYILPFIEQDNVFKTIDFKKPCDDKANAAPRGTVIKTFLSPLDPQMGVEGGVGATNYLWCAGSLHALDNNNGMFARPGKYTIANIPDGSSNTIMAGETLKGNGNAKMTTVQRQHLDLDKAALKGLKDETGAGDWKDGKNVAANRCAAWIDGRFLQGTFTGTRKVNDERPDVNCAGEGGLSALRTTEAGSQIVLGDGSVRFITQTISQETLKLLSDGADGQVIPNDF